MIQDKSNIKDVPFSPFKKNLKDIKNCDAFSAIKQLAIIATGRLPFSSRGIAINVLKFPIRIFQSLGAGIKAIKNKTSFQDNFTQTMSEHMQRDWVGGIKDVYTKLDKTNKEHQEIAKKNIHYANYVYSDKDLIETKNPNDAFYSLNKGYRIDKEGKTNGLKQPQMNENHENIVNNLLKIPGIKFDDKSGYFYSEKTGSIFHLIANPTNQEICMCFLGLKNEKRLTGLDEKQQSKIKSLQHSSITEEITRGVSSSSIEAIKLGKILKESLNESEHKPVVVGHSHGGGLAQAAAAGAGIKGVVFNSRPMGAGTRRFIGQKKIAKNSKEITAFSSKGDPLSATRVINILAVIFERITGVPVPRTIAGNAYEIPTDITKMKGREHGIGKKMEYLHDKPNLHLEEFLEN